MNQLTIVNLLLHSPKDGNDGAYDSGIIGFPVSFLQKLEVKMAPICFSGEDGGGSAVVTTHNDDYSVATFSYSTTISLTHVSLHRLFGALRTY